MEGNSDHLVSSLLGRTSYKLEFSTQRSVECSSEICLEVARHLQATDCAHNPKENLWMEESQIPSAKLYWSEPVCVSHKRAKEYNGEGFHYTEQVNSNALQYTSKHTNKFYYIVYFFLFSKGY